MALTAVSVTRNTINAAGFSSGSLQVPRRLSALAIDTLDAKGFAVTQPENQSPAAICTLTGDADFYVADTDGLATTVMEVVPSGVPWPFQCTPGVVQNFYMKTAVTANIILMIKA